MGGESVLLPLAQMPRAVAAGMHTLFSDIDDTLTTGGRLTAPAYAALEALHSAGLRVVLTTGRPAGWCDHIARMWPVDAVIGENGAFTMWFDGPARKLRVRHLLPSAERAAHRARLADIGARIVREVPGCALASDQFCRLYDLAVDFCEDVPPLPDAAIDRIVTLMQDAGMTAMVSSIHVNGWFGDYDKLSMAKLLMRERWQLDLDTERAACSYAGDSPNDAPMFAYFPHAVGVANVARYGARIAQLPRYVTPSEGGAGFAELAQALIAARQP